MSEWRWQIQKHKKQLLCIVPLNCIMITFISGLRLPPHLLAHDTIEIAHVVHQHLKPILPSRCPKKKQQTPCVTNVAHGKTQWLPCTRCCFPCDSMHIFYNIYIYTSIYTNSLLSIGLYKNYFGRILKHDLFLIPYLVSVFWSSWCPYQNPPLLKNTLVCTTIQTSNWII